MIALTEAREKVRRGDRAPHAPSPMQAIEVRVDALLIDAMRDQAWPLRVPLSEEEAPFGHLAAYLYREVGWDVEVGYEFRVEKGLPLPSGRALVFGAPSLEHR